MQKADMHAVNHAGIVGAGSDEGRAAGGLACHEDADAATEDRTASDENDVQANFLV